ncbi:hypothetical protein [Moorena producens]|nr:hypothetical protein [Moorena producens]
MFFTFLWPLGHATRTEAFVLLLRKSATELPLSGAGVELPAISIHRLLGY